MGSLEATIPGRADAGITLERECTIMRELRDEPLFDTAQAAHYLGGYSASTLNWWRTTSPRRGPNFYKMAGRVKYKKSDLDAFIAAGLVETQG